MNADSAKISQLRGLIKLLVLSGALVFGWLIFFAGQADDPDATSASLTIDLSTISEGESRRIELEGRPVLVVHRRAEEQNSLRETREALYDPESRLSIQPDNSRNAWRSVDPAWLVVFDQSPDTGCRLEMDDDGFTDSCRHSRYDRAGRVFKDQASKRNLQVVPHRFSENSIELFLP